MNRRTLGVSSLAIVTAALFACAPQSPGSAPTAAPVSLSTVQLWSQELTDAIKGAVALDVMPSATVSTAVKAKITQALAVLDAANGALHQVIATTVNTPQQVAAELIPAIEAIVPLLAPLIPALAPTGPIGLAVSAGLMVLIAFANATPIVPPPVPAALHRAALRYRGRR